MSFVLEVVKNGRDIILFNNHKYREGYSIKSGDIVWRCLGRVCKATIKTNKEKTGIFFLNDTHTGAHPVTLRALTPTPPKRDRTSVTAKTTTTPMTVVTPAKTVTPPSPTTHTDLTYTNTPNTSLQNVLMQNSALKKEVEKLRSEKQIILNHSIESDQRLLEYTDEIFLPPQTLPLNASKVQSYSPTKNQNALEEALSKIITLEEEIKKLQRPCTVCSILKEETKKMITSMRCLEEDNRLLKSTIEAKSINTTTELLSQPLIKIHNPYEVLREESTQGLDDEGNFVKVVKKVKANRHLKTKNTTKKFHKAKCGRSSMTKKGQVMTFKAISVIGDSHARGLSGLMRRHMGESVRVTGFCKPGGRLLDVEPTSPPPEDHCYVVIAGTNDVGAGGVRSVFAHLEKIIQTCKQSSKVLLVPLPTRYDLSCSSSVHEAVDLVNSFMTELSFRQQGVEVLDTGTIRRHHHTSHGLHLNKNGKRHLSRLLAERLAEMSPPSGRCNPVERLTNTRQVGSSSSTTSVTVQPSRRATETTLGPHPAGTVTRRLSTSPITLPYESYAEAAAQLPNSHNSTDNDQNTVSKFINNDTNVFLDKATLTSVQN